MAGILYISTRNSSEFREIVAGKALNIWSKWKLPVYSRTAWYVEITKRWGKTLYYVTYTLHSVLLPVTDILTFTAFIYVTKVTQSPT